MASNTKKKPAQPQIVARGEDLVLLEFTSNGVLQRAWIPADAPATVEEGEKGLPYGVDAAALESLLSGSLEKLSASLEHALHTRGLYAAADAESLPEPGRLVDAALKEAVSFLAPHILELVRQS